MAYPYLRKSGRVEIREAHSTSRGPRSRTLASFRGSLCEEILDRAEAAATRPFDRDAVRTRAAKLGIPIASTAADPRPLIARLRRGAHIDPVLATVLSQQLEQADSEPVSDELADVIEWIGSSDVERGHALRDVLRLYDTIARSRATVREPGPMRFPRFHIRLESRAS
jgi:hypothetical protein